MATIAQHGIIGDGRSAALVDTDGTVDWLAWPRFDSDSAFAALLDPGAGSWVVRPAVPFRSSQRYLPGTNVLETSFEAADFRVTVTDCMPVWAEDTGRQFLFPEHELLRVIRCERGSVPMTVRLRLAPGYGLEAARCADRGALGLCVETRQGAFLLRGEPRLVWREHVASADFVLRAGETARFSLSWTAEGPASLPPLGEWSDAAVERSVDWWRGWSAKARYDGPFRDAVVRSALTLKLLCYPPSGAMLAAATTSLPESPGGTMNWDYRFCWLRDAAFTARALYGLGYQDEGDAFVHWLLYVTHTTFPELAVLYDVYGNRPRAERTLDHLRGFGGARPVRAGNAADRQLQLDVQGEVLDAVAEHVAAGAELDRETRGMVAELAHFICGRWRLPDQSLWEVRGPAQHYTHSKVLCWAGLDRALRLHHAIGLEKLDVPKVRRARRELRAWVAANGVDGDHYVDRPGSGEVDAALLLLPWYGYESARSPRILRTFERVLGELNAGGGLLFRNKTLRAQGDEPFVACGFWAAELIALGAGAVDVAEAWIASLLGSSNHLGLFSEEADPQRGLLYGNFPQAYSHVGLISATLAVEERRRLIRRARGQGEEARS